MHALYLVIIILMMTGLVTLINNSTNNITATNGSDLMYSKDTKPYGISFSEWMGKWWQWHVSLQNKVNEQNPSNLSLIHPREAYSSEKCAWDQDNKNVWFLPDGRSLGPSEFTNPEKRKCTVTHDKALLVQIYGGGCDYSKGLTTDKDLEDCVNIGLDTVTFAAKVDGVEVMSSINRNDILPNPYLYNITFTDNNLYDAPVGTYRAAANGYFLFLKPLSIGNHTIEFNEAYLKPGFEGQPSPENRLSNVVYDINVK